MRLLLRRTPTWRGCFRAMPTGVHTPRLKGLRVCSSDTWTRARRRLSGTRSRLRRPIAFVPMPSFPSLPAKRSGTRWARSLCSSSTAGSGRRWAASGQSL
eukprot:Amastigsp_a339769_87.p5 type:complete len:100 gc:universal Amastigsp_a339769_87:1474-1175(-)